MTPEKLGSPDKLEGLRFEKGFWKAWLETYAYELGPPVGCSVRMQLKDNLDKPIEERVAACANGLGEDGEAWVDAWAGPLKARLETRVVRGSDGREANVLHQPRPAPTCAVPTCVAPSSSTSGWPAPTCAVPTCRDRR